MFVSTRTFARVGSAACVLLACNANNAVPGGPADAAPVGNGGAPTQRDGGPLSDSGSGGARPDAAIHRAPDASSSSGAGGDAGSKERDAGPSTAGNAAVGSAGASGAGGHSGDAGTAEPLDGGLAGFGGDGSQEAGAGGRATGGAGAGWGGSGGAEPVDPGPPGTFHISATLASDLDPIAPATVGVVTFSVTDVSVASAVIEFGLDTDYGMVAPVDLDEPDYRTLLLGMKPERVYHFRIRVETTSGTYQSKDQMLETGPPGPPVVSRFEVLDEARYEGGFIIASYWRSVSATGVFILDRDGEVVWFRQTPLMGVARAAFSEDGKNLWLVSTNNAGGPVYRLSLDGLELEQYPGLLGSHDITAVEGSKMAFLEYGETDCDSVYEIDVDGSFTEVFELSDYVVGATILTCHGNAVRYSRVWDSYVVSSLQEDVFIVPRDGSEVRRLSEIVPGGNEAWGGTQHGVHFLGHSLLLFANDEGSLEGGFQSGGPSTVIEYSLLDGSEVWRYESDHYSSNLGDVQRLPGGNTLITYSNDALMQQVTPSGEVVFEAATGGQPFGYTTWRASLYGVLPDLSEGTR